MSIKKIERHELIGSNIKIIGSKNPSLIGFRGKIIDETENMLIVQGKTQKKIIKNQVKMVIKFNNKEIIIEGKEIVGRPADRLKK